MICNLINNTKKNATFFSINYFNQLTTPVSPTKNALWFKTNSVVQNIVIVEDLEKIPYQNPDTIYLVSASEGEKITFYNSKKEEVIYHLKSAYLNGKRIDGFIYKENRWVQFSTVNFYFYNRGDLCSYITGGWSHKKFSPEKPNEVIFGPSKIAFNSNGAQVHGDSIIRTENRISCEKKGIKTLKCEIKLTQINSPDYYPITFGLLDTGEWTDILSIGPGKWTAKTSVSRTSGSIITLALDVSQISGNYYIGFYTFGAGEIYSVWGEE